MQHCALNFTLHSMLSRWDDVGSNKWWINELNCRIVAFLARGEPFELERGQHDAAEGGEQFCHLDCSSERCRSEPAQLACPSCTQRGALIQV